MMNEIPYDLSILTPSVEVLINNNDEDEDEE
jgi:hypothetical protein